MGFKKRGAIYSVIALMLCVAVYLHASYTSEPDDLMVDSTNIADKTIGQRVEVSVTEPPQEGELVSVNAQNDYFSEARLSRQKARDEAVSILTGTIDSEGASEDAKAAANTNIQLMATSAMTESRIENLVIAKGYVDCVAFVSDTYVNVIVSKAEKGLNDVDVARIKDIVMSEGLGEDVVIKVIEAI